MSINNVSIKLTINVLIVKTYKKGNLTEYQTKLHLVSYNLWTSLQQDICDTVGNSF